MRVNSGLTTLHEAAKTLICSTSANTLQQGKDKTVLMDWIKDRGLQNIVCVFKLYILK